MLLKAHRFHGRTSLKNVYRYGRVVKNGLLSLRYQENPHRASYRLAIVVSKKVEKSAVGRNRMRRRIYEIVRAKEHKISKPYDIVMTVFNSDVATMAAQELTKTVDDLLNKADITHKN